jgi:hypothetical protein
MQRSALADKLAVHALLSIKKADMPADINGVDVKICAVIRLAVEDY